MMKQEKNVEKTMEDYLEAILMIQERRGAVRSIDVANQLGVTKPSVTYTTKRLKERGYIVMDEYNFITLTDDGMKIASRTYNRHKILTKFFISLGVSEAVAKADACLIEHDLSPETFDALCEHIQKTEALR